MASGGLLGALEIARRRESELWWSAGNIGCGESGRNRTWRRGDGGAAALEKIFRCPARRPIRMRGIVGGISGIPAGTGETGGFFTPYVRPVVAAAAN